jgi:hypothetical protein
MYNIYNNCVYSRLLKLLPATVRGFCKVQVFWKSWGKKSAWK